MWLSAAGNQSGHEACIWRLATCGAYNTYHTLHQVIDILKTFEVRKWQTRLYVRTLARSCAHFDMAPDFKIVWKVIIILGLQIHAVLCGDQFIMISFSLPAGCSDEASEDLQDMAWRSWAKSMFCAETQPHDLSSCCKKIWLFTYLTPSNTGYVEILTIKNSIHLHVHSSDLSMMKWM